MSYKVLKPSRNGQKRLAFNKPFASVRTQSLPGSLKCWSKPTPRFSKAREILLLFFQPYFYTIAAAIFHPLLCLKMKPIKELRPKFVGAVLVLLVAGCACSGKESHLACLTLWRIWHTNTWH